ncbi:MAG: catechol 1,2-dioxygenase [Saprospiraceae bacterium]|nr:catechol 1,2-dioxygenase [Saprospiraceae bacterium]
MKRRNFVKRSALSAFAISTTGFIRLQGKTFVGDCQTTTDILGPFYRPNAPKRSDLVIPGLPGDIVMLKGRVLHDDCKTALSGAKVELWHCSAEEIYDNESDDYNYRGTTYADADGNYHFRTQMPVPYDAGGGMYRPAHFHMMISGEGYQNLVTQLYFTGDPWLTKDRSSNAANAKSRILDVQNDDSGRLMVPFDIVMQKELPLDPIALDRLVGIYADETDPEKTLEFFKHEDQLWLRNEVFGENFRYLGKNTFEMPNTGDWGGWQVRFDIQSDGSVKAISTEAFLKEEKTTTLTKKI